MKLLVCHPGADWATADVHEGYVEAFKALGHEVGVYNLSVRLDRAENWLLYNWRRAGRPDPKPTPADTIYQASNDLVPAALRGNADWVVIITGAYLHPDALILLRRAGVKTALILTESPYEDALQRRVVPLADVVFTNERTSVAQLRAENPNVYYLPHAYDPAKHSTTPPEYEPLVPAHDVVFVGTGFQERLDVLSAVDWTGIDLGLYGTYELMGSRSKLRQYLRGGLLDNRAAAAFYRRAKIGLNLYRQSVKYSRRAERITDAESMNPRALELAACGVFTISDHRAEVEEVFGDLVPTFSDPAELERLIRDWLADAEGRQQAAHALPARVARSSYTDRATRVADFLDACGREIAETRSA